MTLRDLELVLDWAAAEGWNPGLDDAAAFLAADPDGFLLKRVDGRPAAAIAVVNHAPDFAFLGLYICHPDFRGQGHGMDVWRAGLAHAGGRTVGLDGVPAQQENYARSGFAGTGRTIRYQGRLPARTAPEIRPAAARDLPALLALDAAWTGVARAAFLTAWFTPAATRRTLLIGPPGAPLAHGTIRACRDGAKIGPFAAPTRATALTLLEGLAATGPYDTIFIDIPQAAGKMAQLVEGIGFIPVFETARMYLGPPPRPAPAPFYGVATLELG
ncbi:GNAT family N-acetyltransferase [Actibacterium sp. D379-3]